MPIRCDVVVVGAGLLGLSAARALTRRGADVIVLKQAYVGHEAGGSATGACHSPHQPPPRWLEQYRGRFDLGWDAWRQQVFARQLASGLLPPSTVLTGRPAWVPSWDSLDAGERRVAARRGRVRLGSRVRVPQR